MRLKGRRLPYQAQNALEALMLLSLVDDDDLDECEAYCPAHPTIQWLKKDGAW